MSGPGALSGASALVESALRAFMDGRTLPLYSMMAYHLGWLDEQGAQRPFDNRLRLHGALCILAASAAGGSPDGAARYAAAVELLHGYSLIHTDIQEGNPDRDGRPSLWWVWGPAQGINAGDGMHALARLALFSLKEEGVAAEQISLALRHLDEANLVLCEGAYLDTVFQERLNVAVPEYLSMARSMGGAPVAAAARLGALSAGVREGALFEAFGEFGMKLGTAMRIADDYSAFWSAEERGETAQGRLLAKKKTLPVVHAVAASDAHTRRELGNLYARRMIGPDDIPRIAAVAESAGSRQFTRDTVAELLADARAALGDTGIEDEPRAGLEAAAAYAVESRMGDAA